MNSLLDWIADLGGPLLLLATFLLAFGESAALVDFFVPGEPWVKFPILRLTLDLPMHVVIASLVNDGNGCAQ